MPYETQTKEIVQCTQRETMDTVFVAVYQYHVKLTNYILCNALDVLCLKT